MSFVELKFREVLSVINYVSDAKHPIMLRGRHGIGKSELVYQFAESKGMKVVERRASQMTEGDLVGLPLLTTVNAETGEIEGVSNVANHNDPKDIMTHWCPPDWFMTAAREPVVLFLDELDRATPEVRQGIFELADSRKINGMYLHPDTLIFACVNSGHHGEEYQVSQMDPAELDRWTVFDVHPDVTDWLKWGETVGNINQIILEFISVEQEWLEHKGQFEPNVVYPSRRSWKRFSDAAFNLLESMQEKNEKFLRTKIIARGYLGDDCAGTFLNYLNNREWEIDPEAILDGSRVKEMKDAVITDHVKLLEKFKKQKTLMDPLTTAQIKNFYAFLDTVPSELWMGWQEVLFNNYVNHIDNIKNMFTNKKLRHKLGMKLFEGYRGINHDTFIKAE